MLPGVPVKRIKCGCAQTRAIPLYLVSDTLTKIRQLLVGHLSPDEPVETYRCRHCKQVVVITAGDLYFVDS